MVELIHCKPSPCNTYAVLRETSTTTPLPPPHTLNNRGRIFSHVRPFYERAVSDQAQSCERVWGHQNLGIFSWKSFTENWSCERALKDKVLRENLVPSPKYSRSPSVLQSTLCMCTYTSVEFFETKCFHRYLIYSSSFTSHLSLFTSHLFL